MKPIPMTICVHTNQIKFSDYGNMSLLGEPLNEPLMRCRVCNKQPEFYYHSLTQAFYIDHKCKEDIYLTETSYAELCHRWNKERGKTYGKD